MSAKRRAIWRSRSRRGLRDIADQVVVITGGSSGVGRETALRFGRAGAEVVVLARDETKLVETVALITDQGGTARYIVCDVTDFDAVHSAVAVVERDLGRIDTWVGNAGVLLYANLVDTDPDDLRDLLDVNVVGQFNGIRAAVPALRRAGGGALICVTSVEAVVTLPLHSAYAASKRAVEAALDGLRRELRADRVPVSVTAVRPTVIDTPIYRHARSSMPWKPAAPPPYYRPAVVAQAILFAATHPVRTIHAGGAGRALVAAQTAAPGLLDALIGLVGSRLMHTDEPTGPQTGNLRGPDHGADSTSNLPRLGRRWSLYTWSMVHPVARSVALITALTFGAVILAGRLNASRVHPGIREIDRWRGPDA